MDIISRHAPHNYYLRSLESSEQQISMPPFHFNMGPVLSGEDAAPVDSGAGLSARPMALVHRCPYVLPTLSLPALPTPKGSSAGDFYEALETRDQEIRKGGTKRLPFGEFRSRNILWLGIVWLYEIMYFDGSKRFEIIGVQI